MVDIKGKKILLIGIDFYDYEKSIIKILEQKGAQVYYFSSYINTYATRILERLKLNSLSKRLIEKEIEQRIDNQPVDIDYLLIIKADNFTRKHIQSLKEKYPGTPVVLYFWDSLKRMSNSELLLQEFPVILTFDRPDAERHRLLLRPLFFRGSENKKTEIKYDISFVGADHSIRYNILRKLAPVLDEYNVKYKFILITGKLKYFLNRYMWHTIKKGDEYLFCTKRLSYNEYVEISDSSNAILDISHPLQDGLTMRSIETLCLGKKIMTTNRDIENYDFPKSLYYVLDISKIGNPTDFLKTPPTERFNSEKYTLESFVEELLSHLVINGRTFGE